MIVLFPLGPLRRCDPDDMYAAEAAAAGRLAVPWFLIDHDALVQGEADRAVRRVAVQPQPVVAVYRGYFTMDVARR